MLYELNSSIPYSSYRNCIRQKKIHPLLELKIKLLKFCISDKRIKYNLKFLLKIKNLNFYGRSLMSKKFGCRVTGKTRFIFSWFNLNRSTLKQYSAAGFIAGFKHK